MARTEASRFLHVANGTATTAIIEAAGIPGMRSIWADPLSDGPLPGSLNDDELVEVRARFLADHSGASVDTVANELRTWRRTVASHDAYDELVLWFEHDLFDQLNLIQVLAWIHERLPAGKPVSLVCVNAFPGRATFRGLGELTPRELGSLFGTRQVVGPSQFALAARAWDAFRSPSPQALDEVRRSDTGALPFLAPALKRLLEEYPWTRDGLSRTERRLLQLLDARPADAATLFPRMHDGEAWYFITDLSFSALIASLSATVPALVAHDASDTTPAGGTLPAGTLAITNSGRAVLNGERDRVAACGLDRWLGGVHLHADAGIWRWDEPGDRVVRS